MRIALYIIILFFIKSTFANEITIIELHNKSIDQVLIENLENENNQQSKKEILDDDLESKINTYKKKLNINFNKNNKNLGHGRNFLKVYCSSILNLVAGVAT